MRFSWDLGRRLSPAVGFVSILGGSVYALSCSQHIYIGLLVSIPSLFRVVAFLFVPPRPAPPTPTMHVSSFFSFFFSLQVHAAKAWESLLARACFRPLLAPNPILSLEPRRAGGPKDFVTDSFASSWHYNQWVSGARLSEGIKGWGGGQISYPMVIKNCRVDDHLNSPILQHICNHNNNNPSKETQVFGAEIYLRRRNSPKQAAPTAPDSSRVVAANRRQNTQARYHGVSSHAPHLPRSPSSGNL